MGRRAQLSATYCFPSAAFPWCLLMKNVKPSIERILPGTRSLATNITARVPSPHVPPLPVPCPSVILVVQPSRDHCRGQAILHGLQGQSRA